MKSAVTERQQAVIDAIRDHWSEHGYAPSIRGLMSATGIGSPNGIMCHLKALRAKGVVSWEPTVPRSIRVIGDGTEAAPELHDACKRLLAIVVDCIMKGMPVTREVAEARNLAVKAIAKAESLA